MFLALFAQPELALKDVLPQNTPRLRLDRVDGSSTRASFNFDDNWGPLPYGRGSVTDPDRRSRFGGWRFEVCMRPVYVAAARCAGFVLPSRDRQERVFG